MLHHSARTFFVIVSFAAILVGCTPNGSSQIAIAPVPPTATPTPVRATAMPKPATPTTQLPTPTNSPVIPTAAPPTSKPTITVTQEAVAVVPFGDPVATPPADLPADWVFHDKSNVGFTFALPAGWRVQDVSEDQADQNLDDLKQRVPEMEDLLRNDSGQKIIACDCKALRRGVPSFLDVNTYPLPYAVPFDEIVNGTVQGLESMPFTVRPVNHTRIKHPNGPAEALQYRIRVPNEDGEPVLLTATQYVLVGEDQLLVVTIVTSIENAEESTPIFYKIGQTFRITPIARQPM